ncbi:MAG: hypothetical protein QXV97_06000 [Candidatus Caldarchaeum sp.]
MQSSLDSWLEDVEKGVGKTVEERRRVVSPSDHTDTCSYRSLKTLFHAGSIYVFYHPDETRIYKLPEDVKEVVDSDGEEAEVVNI